MQRSEVVNEVWVKNVHASSLAEPLVRDSNHGLLLIFFYLELCLWV